MKLISLNIFGGTHLDPLVSYLKSQDADILCLQEVYSSTYDELYVNPPGLGVNKYSIEKINQDLQYPHLFFSPNYQTPYKQGHFQFGNAILSRYPIVSEVTTYYDIPYRVNPKSTTELEFFKTFTPDTHPRNFQTVQLQVNDAILHVTNTHGIWQPNKGKGDTDRSLEMTNKLLKNTKNKSSIVTGDFNLLPNTSSMQKFDKAFENLVVKNEIITTRPSERAKQVIDYIFTSKDIEVKKFRVDETEVSDHLPLVVEF